MSFTHLACPPPPSVTNAMVSYLGYTAFSGETVTAATVANYTCKPNFALIGSYIIDCTNGSLWTPGVPTCEGYTYINIYQVYQ